MDTHSEFQKRLNRYVTANYNEKPDRVPLRIFAEEFAAKYSGYNNFEVAINHELQFDVNRKFAVETGIDAIQTNSVVNWFGMQKALGWEGINYPGIGLPVDSTNQWSEPTTDENAFLKASEYDEFIDDPTPFLVNKWLPRFTRHIKQPGQAVTYEHNMSLINGVMAYDKFFGTWGAKTAELINAGVVPAVASVLKAPLDIIGDKLRGYVNLCYDLHQCRDKVIAACEALMPHLANLVIGGADPDRNIPSIIWMHRGCIPFISRKDFDEIYWPTLKPIVEELWAQGHQIIFYAEGNWDHHLNAFAELPEKSIIFHCDKTDINQAHQVLGKKFCLSGGVSNDLLARGAPEEVKATCKKVIDTVGQDGGYIMDASALIMNDARTENVKAMIDFTLDYGVYNTSSLPSLAEIKQISRPESTTQIKYPEQKRKPGVCIPWAEKRQELPQIVEREELVQKVWEDVDSLGYGFCWVNLTW
ncbi:MAG: uroporphyrinogen decarboxylase family protein [Anaerolineaceae bacterium]|nr:uroporphyrinogen decarboxylase family protein [Anaerolineaceae bacterium]